MDHSAPPGRLNNLNSILHDIDIKIKKDMHDTDTLSFETLLIDYINSGMIEVSERVLCSSEDQAHNQDEQSTRLST